MRLEAGTGSIGDAVALGEALTYLGNIEIAEVGRWEHMIKKTLRKFFSELE